MTAQSHLWNIRKNIGMPSTPAQTWKQTGGGKIQLASSTETTLAAFLAAGEVVQLIKARNIGGFTTVTLKCAQKKKGLFVKKLQKK